TSHSADDIAEQLENRGVSLSITVNRHGLSLVCTCLVEDLDSTLATIADIAMHPAFSDPEVETRRGETITMIRQDADSPARLATSSRRAPSMPRRGYSKDGGPRRRLRSPFRRRPRSANGACASSR